VVAGGAGGIAFVSVCSGAIAVACWGRLAAYGWALQERSWIEQVVFGGCAGSVWEL
jgi:hypothetical protein